MSSTADPLGASGQGWHSPGRDRWTLQRRGQAAGGVGFAGAPPQPGRRRRGTKRGCGEPPFLITAIPLAERAAVLQALGILFLVLASQGKDLVTSKKGLPGPRARPAPWHSRGFSEAGLGAQAGRLTHSPVRVLTLPPGALSPEVRKGTPHMRGLGQHARLVLGRDGG